MELISLLRQFSIAKWVKISAVILIAIAFLSVIMVVLFGFLGAYSKCNPYYLFCVVKNLDADFFKNIGDLLGVFLPFALVVLLFSGYQSGVETLDRYADGVLVDLIPSRLKRVNSFQRVAVNKWNNPSSCVYSLEINDGSVLQFIVELNVKKVNVIIDFYADSVEALLNSKLSSSFSGAEHEGYKIDTPKLIRDRVVRVVLRKNNLPNDFLWNSAEKLYFSNDLCYFIHSLVPYVRENQN
jgi:hypothetical protein